MSPAYARARPNSTASPLLYIKFLLAVLPAGMVGGDDVRAGDGVKSFLQQTYSISSDVMAEPLPEPRSGSDFTPPPNTYNACKDIALYQPNIRELKLKHKAEAQVL